jgi:hypothetical protein
MDFHKQFFERGFRLQSRLMAVFGTKAESIFKLFHFSIAEIRMAADIISVEDYVDEDREAQKAYEEVRNKLKGVLFEDVSDAYGKKQDRIRERLMEFREEIEGLCKPIVDREYRRT